MEQNMEIQDFKIITWGSNTGVSLNCFNARYIQTILYITIILHIQSILSSWTVCKRI